MHRGQLGPECCLDAVFVQMTLMGTYQMAQVNDDQDFTLSERLVLRVCIVMPTYLPLLSLISLSDGCIGWITLEQWGWDLRLLPVLCSSHRHLG